MSNQDSFIDEVTEEVRREKLFTYVRRYGWIAGLLVVLIVAGAAWNEWRKAEARAVAEARGDALLAALSTDDPSARAAALESLRGAGPAEPVIALLEASAQSEPTEARATLAAAAADPAVPQIYRDLATLKAAMLGAGVVPPEALISELAPLTLPGGAFRPLAIEQTALAHVAAGDSATAIALLTDLLGAAEGSAALRRRAAQLIVALGGSLDAT